MKVKKLLVASILSVLSTTAVWAQQVRNCGTMEYLEYQMQNDPALSEKMQEIEHFTNQFIASNQGTAKAIVTIPVVFHVVYNTSAQNISDALILAQLDQLNKDYARLNSDAGSTPSAFQSLAVNTNIQFCMAQRDPSGNATTGIVRKSTTVTSFSSNDAVKYTAQGGDNAWDATKYFNIWVCNLGGGLLGYAQFPGGAAATDGVVLLYSSVGSLTTPGSATPYNYGRTATHEVGHWLNLRHIWGDANCGNDQVSDTPTQQTSNYGCPTFPHVTCSNGANGDMFMNYMDYTDDACMNMFTSGQSTRMAALFATGGARIGLVSSNGCSAPTTTGCGTPSSLAAGSLTTTSASLSWTGVSGAVSYNVQYKTTAATTWTTVSTTATTYALSGLSAATSYQFQVQAVCSSQSGSYSAATGFTTASTTTTCTDNYEANETRTAGKTISTNTDIFAKIGTSTDKDWFKFTTTTAAKNIKVVLDQLPADYDLKLFNNSGTQLGVSQNTSTTAETIIRNTTSTGTYYVQVYGYSSAYNANSCYRLRVNVSSSSFRTIENADEESMDVVAMDEVSLYPNPNNGNFIVTILSDNENDVNIRVNDITGKTIYTGRFNSTKGENNFNLDLQGQAKGIYFVEVNHGETKTIKKLIVE
ncbi:MAG: T9SS type A sorting domain-containing protein [Bacteroidia bacterium]|nr:T9SS type A sorting domain-containing protein [Bacteroidia bacterium]